jgi:hypothetical protein
VIGPSITWQCLIMGKVVYMDAKWHNGAEIRSLPELVSREGSTFGPHAFHDKGAPEYNAMRNFQALPKFIRIEARLYKDTAGKTNNQAYADQFPLHGEHEKAYHQPES